MILSGLLTFLGGSAFRMIWGEVSSFLTKKQEHSQELDRLRLQEQIDQAAHARDMESIKLQSELGLKEVVARGQQELNKVEADAFVEAMKNANKPTGIKWVDAWNGCIRPTVATMAVGLWVFQVFHNHFVLAAFDLDIIATVLGFYFADRSLSHRGK